MKHFYTFIFIVLSTYALGQEELDGTWYVHYINVNSENQYHDAFHVLNPVLNFDVENSSLNGGVCNSYEAEYSVLSDSVINISNFSQTLATCDSQPIEQGFETGYFQILAFNQNNNEGAQINFSIQGSSNESILTISNSVTNNWAVLGRIPLENPISASWYLSHMNYQGVQYMDDYNITLNLSENEAVYNGFEHDGNSSCNSHSGLYGFATNNRIVTLFGSSTDMDCSPNLEQEYEDAYLSVFYEYADWKFLNYSIINIGDTQTLSLKDSDNNELVYTDQSNTSTIFGIWNLIAVEHNGELLNTPSTMSSDMYFTTNLSNNLFYMQGYGGYCNLIDGEFSPNNNASITIYGASITLQDCGPGELNDFENLYYSILGYDDAISFDTTFSNDGLSLTLLKDNGDKLIFGRESLSIEENNWINELGLVKNPIQDELVLTDAVTSIMNKEVTFSIIDVTGKTIEANGLNSNKISVDYLDSGIYFLKLTSIVGESKILRFIKN